MQDLAGEKACMEIYNKLTQGISGAIGRRRDARLRLGVPAQLITLHGQFSANLCDLSQSGAHVRAKGDLFRGEDAVLLWLGFEAFGKIVWVDNGEGGLEFDEMLAPAILIQTRDQVDLGQIQSADQAAYEGVRSWFMGYR